MSVKIRWREDRQAYEVTYYLHGKRKRPLFREKPEALNFKRKIELGLSPEDRDSISIDEAGKKYFAGPSARKSKASRRNDKRYINLHFHFMTYERGIERLASVRLEDMEAFRDWLATLSEYDDKPMKMGPSTVNRCLAVMKHFYIQHVRWRSIIETPCLYLEFLSSEEKPREAAGGAQYLSALDKSPDWFKPVMQFVYLTGAPGSCVERLKWADVDFVGRTYAMFRKKGKEAKWKRIPMQMTDSVFALLIMVRNLWPSTEGPVFRDGAGRALLADRICKTGSRAFKAAGFANLTLYSMRHGLASDLTAANVATEIVRQAMGHASISTTQKYANKIGSKPVVGAIDTVRKQMGGGSLVAIAADMPRMDGDKK